MDLGTKSTRELPNGDEEVQLRDQAVRLNTSVDRSSYGEPGGMPSITGRQLRMLIRESVGSAGSPRDPVAQGRFRERFRRLLGVESKGVNPLSGQEEFRLVEGAQISPNEFSIRDLCYEFLGGQTVGGLGNPKTADATTRELREALGPTTASAFQDINAFNQTIGGLVEVRILQGYNLPEFIGDEMMEEMPTKVNGGKLIGLPNLTLPDGPTAESTEFPDVRMQERWVIAPSNVKYAQKTSLTREAVVYDLSGELLSTAETMGMSLRYVKEYWQAGVVQGRDIVAGTPGFLKGRTCNTFIYKGQPTDTPNATYQTAAGAGASAKYNYVNALTNQLTDWTSFQTVQQKLNLMREFETNYPIMTKFDEIIVSPNKEYNARAVVHATQVLPATGVLSGQSNFPSNIALTANPIPTLRIRYSNIWNKQLVDSGLSQPNADIYWYGGWFKRAFVFRKVWDFGIVQANPLTTEMLQSDIVNAWYASWYGVPMVRDPHFAINNTN